MIITTYLSLQGVKITVVLTDFTHFYMFVPIYI